MSRSWLCFLAASVAVSARAQAPAEGSTKVVEAVPGPAAAEPGEAKAAPPEEKGGEKGEAHDCCKHGGEHGECDKHGGEHAEHGDDCEHGECPGHHQEGDGCEAGCPAHQRKWDIGLDGYLRTEFETLWPERLFYIRMPATKNQNPYVGRNDGFVLGNARLNVRASYGPNLYLRLGFDGSDVAYDSDNEVVGHLSTGLKDAYTRFTVAEPLQIYVGRFKPPYDVEELTPEGEQQFVHRSLESRGVERHEGFANDTPGFAPGRQLGVMFGGRALAFDGGALDYSAAVTNGNSGDRSLNDNDLPAVWGRVEMTLNQESKTDEEGPATFSLDKGIRLGASSFYNEVTFGIAPNRFTDRVVGAGVDGAVMLSVFDLRAQLLWSRTAHLLRFGDVTDQALGGHIQLGVHIPDTGFEPGYRFAYYEPRWKTEDAAAAPADFDRLMHHTVGVRYTAHNLPVVGWFEYTRSIEQGTRVLDNDRFEAALQVDFQ